MIFTENILKFALNGLFIFDIGMKPNSIFVFVNICHLFFIIIMKWMAKELDFSQNLAVVAKFQ